jgi:hypothetical protein
VLEGIIYALDASALMGDKLPTCKEVDYELWTVPSNDHTPRCLLGEGKQGAGVVEGLGDCGNRGYLSNCNDARGVGLGTCNGHKTGFGVRKMPIGKCGDFFVEMV